jgi:hypothetical protein
MERTCGQCRRRFPPPQLMRLPAPERTRRRAWVCVSGPCLAAQGGDVAALARHEALKALGLARRQGAVQLGLADAKLEPGTALAACDLGTRARAQAQALGAHFFVSKAELGRALGAGSVGFCRVQHERLSDRVGQWVRVWHAATNNSGVVNGQDQST